MTCIINCLVQPEMNMMFWELKREALTLKWEGEIREERSHLRTQFTLLCRRTRWARHTVKLGRRESTRGGEAKGMMLSTRDSAPQPRTHTMPSRCSRCPLTKWHSCSGRARLRQVQMLWARREGKQSSIQKRPFSQHPFFQDCKVYMRGSLHKVGQIWI
ncbi:T-cell surface glycoprotein CD3 zeta chain isoform X4 [Chrysemys picta bellii]|uniref:T-cell surface glycoprotein CD3 zeta chain isoform X4 n=1 Tax=Chrysemys picta bellii TaxID=8478 RepID=UPI0032B21E9D